MEDDEVRRAAARLVAARSWLALATLAADGSPLVSYVPFAPVGGAFGIVVSGLAAHTENLIARPSASILVVDEGEGERDAYARARMSVKVTARPMESGPAADAVWSALLARHGATVETLRALPDFRAVALVPDGGRLVLGFAAARTLRGDEVVALLWTGAR